MSTKIFFPILAVLFLFVMGGYFLSHPSYEKSLKAKYHYEMGEYKEALALSREAFALDRYNRMAATIMAQSLTSMKYIKYIEDAKKYMKQITAIAAQESILDADKAKIRIIAQIMLSAHLKLAPSVVTDTELVKDASRYQVEFEKLLEKIDK